MRIVVVGGVMARDNIQTEMNYFIKDVENCICNNSKNILESETGYIIPVSKRPFYSEDYYEARFAVEFETYYVYRYGNL